MEAKWSDGHYYKAQIKKQTDKGFEVDFYEWNVQLDVPIQDIKKIPELNYLPPQFIDDEKTQESSPSKSLHITNKPMPKEFRPELKDNLTNKFKSSNGTCSINNSLSKLLSREIKANELPPKFYLHSSRQQCFF